MHDNPFFARETIRVRPTDQRGVVAGVNPPRSHPIQQAVDALRSRGGGTVIVEAGEYTLTEPIRLRSDVRLAGDGQVVLTRPPRLAVSELLCDVDVGQNVFTPAHPDRFKPGMAVCFHDRQRGFAHGTQTVTVTDVRDGQVYFDTMNTLDRLAENDAVAMAYFPLMLGVDADRALVENLVLDGAMEDTPPKGRMPRTFGIYLYHSRMCTVRNVEARNIYGDGICFGKASLHTTVEDCHTHHNSNYGIHPGSHSARCAIRRCHIHDNGSDGLYICWGISHSVFEDNDIHDNGRLDWRSGISIGHKDTDNVLARNTVRHNAKFGICVRIKTAANGAHRNVFRENVIEDNGHDPANIPERFRSLPADELVSCGVFINGTTDGLVFERNVIRETRDAAEQRQHYAFVVNENVTNLTLRDNEVGPHPEGEMLDRREAAATV
ncbi:MAG: right-handed parallel beta-helix repeat-containing protein [Phycisphaeraceae bacterium]